MKKFIVAAASAGAMLGLAACSDTDGTTTQGVPAQEEPMAQEPAATPPPADQQEEQAPAN